MKKSARTKVRSWSKDIKECSKMFLFVLDVFFDAQTWPKYAVGQQPLKTFISENKENIEAIFQYVNSHFGTDQTSIMRKSLSDRISHSKKEATPKRSGNNQDATSDSSMTDPKIFKCSRVTELGLSPNPKNCSPVTEIVSSSESS